MPCMAARRLSGSAAATTARGSGFSSVVRRAAATTTTRASSPSPLVRFGGVRGRQRLRGPPPASASTFEGPPPMRGDVVDFYELLGVDDDASPEAIKAAYRALARTCHPDVHSDGHALCILLNEAYETLSSPDARESYNAQLQAALDSEDDDYTGKPLSKWLVGHRRGKAQPGETRAVFVDELSCIGCKNCIFEAAATFRVEREHGRARVFAQWLDDEAKIQRSIDSCPVSCIHWVDKDDLPALEHVTQKVLTDRPGVAAMMSGQGGAIDDPFAAAARFLKRREQKAEAARRAAAAASPEAVRRRREAAEAIRREQFGAWYGFASAVEAAATAAASAATAAAEASVSPAQRAEREAAAAAAAAEAAEAAASASAAAAAAAAAAPSASQQNSAVGFRKRAPRKVMNEGGGIVPDERALVLARDAGKR